MSMTSGPTVSLAGSSRSQLLAADSSHAVVRFRRSAVDALFHPARRWPSPSRLLRRQFAWNTAKPHYIRCGATSPCAPAQCCTANPAVQIWRMQPVPHRLARRRSGRGFRRGRGPPARRRRRARRRVRSARRAAAARPRRASGRSASANACTAASIGPAVQSPAAAASTGRSRSEHACCASSSAAPPPSRRGRAAARRR